VDYTPLMAEPHKIKQTKRSISVVLWESDRQMTQGDEGYAL
jgi:hypothetical protein